MVGGFLSGKLCPGFNVRFPHDRPDPLPAAIDRCKRLIET